VNEELLDDSSGILLEFDVWGCEFADPKNLRYPARCRLKPASAKRRAAMLVACTSSG